MKRIQFRQQILIIDWTNCNINYCFHVASNKERLIKKGEYGKIISHVQSQLESLKLMIETE